MNRFTIALRKANWLIIFPTNSVICRYILDTRKRMDKKRQRQVQTHYSSGSFRIFSNANIVGKTHKNYHSREIYNNCHLGIFHSSSLSLVPPLTVILSVVQPNCIFGILSGSSRFKQIRPRLRYFYVASGAIAFLQRTLTPFLLTFYLEKPLTDTRRILW